MSNLFTRLSTAFLIGLLILNPALADKAGALKASYTAEKVSESVYVIHGPLGLPDPSNQGFMNNPAFVIGDNGIIIIDAGGTAQTGDMVLALIKTISDLPVVATFSSHIHGDHWLANQAITDAYPDVRHFAHPKLIEQASAGEGQSWVDLMMTLTEGASAGTAFLAPKHSTDEGQKHTIEGKTFSVYHDELAHTNTDIGIFLEGENVLFMGDTVMGGRLGRLDDGNFKGLIAFLDRMLALNASVVVPGHGQSGDQTVLLAYKNVMETIFDTVKVEYENGLADFEMKPLIIEKLPNIAQWSDLEEALGKLISLAYLEVEDDSF